MQTSTEITSGVTNIEHDHSNTRKKILAYAFSVAATISTVDTNAETISVNITNAHVTNVLKATLPGLPPGGKILVTKQTGGATTNNLVPFTTPYGTVTIDSRQLINAVANPDNGTFTFTPTTKSMDFLKSLPDNFSLNIQYKTTTATGQNMLTFNQVLVFNKSLLLANTTPLSNTVAVSNVAINYSDMEDSSNKYTAPTPETTTNIAQVLSYTPLSATGKGALGFGYNTDLQTNYYTYTPQVDSTNPSKMDYSIITPQEKRYSVTDGLGSSVMQRVIFTLKNEAPVGLGKAYESYGNPIVGEAEAINKEKYEKLRFVKGTEPTNGSLIFNQDGTFKYTPNMGYVGSDGFTFTVFDEASNSSSLGYVNFNIVKPGIVISFTPPTARCNGETLYLNEVGGYEIRFQIINAGKFTYIDIPVTSFTNVKNGTELRSTTISDALVNYDNLPLNTMVGGVKHSVVQFNKLYTDTWDKSTLEIAAYDKNGLYSRFVNLNNPTPSDCGNQ